MKLYKNIKVMIVDDESIFREYLINNVDWGFLGLEVCCEAKNGIEGYEMAVKNRPDIALVDINMPLLDGLGLSEKLKATFPEIAIVLITGHSEFEYARKALKLNVWDYVLKPFEDEELIGILLKIKSKILKDEEQKKIVQNNRNMVKEQLLNYLIINDSDFDEEEFMKQLEYIGMKINYTFFKVATIEIDNLFQRWKDPKEIELWRYAVSNILNEVAGVDSTHFIFNGPEGRIVLLIELKNSQDSVSIIERNNEEFCSLIQKYLKFTVTVGIGSVYESLRGIRTSYMESIVALQGKFTSGNNQVIHYQDVSQESINIGFYPSAINEAIILSMRTNNRENIKEKLDEIFSYIRNKRLSLDYTYTICWGLISLCLSFITESENDIADVFGEKFMPLFEMRKKESLEILQKWVESMFQVAVDHCNGRKTSKSKKIAESVIGYINEHFCDSELCLEKIANGLYINPDYLRVAFKKEMAITITDYIINFRMKKAKEFLISDNIKLSNIAEMVGYSDAGYFSKCFKKYFGISPSDYINSKRL